MRDASGAKGASAYSNFENDLAPVVGVEVVVGVGVVSRQHYARHRLAKRDTGTETTFALELDEAGAQSAITLIAPP